MIKGEYEVIRSQTQPEIKAENTKRIVLLTRLVCITRKGKVFHKGTAIQNACYPARELTVFSSSPQYEKIESGHEYRPHTMMGSPRR